MGKRRRPQRPNNEQLMFIRKHGLEPLHEWLVIWEKPDFIRVHNYVTRESLTLEK